MIIVIKPIIKLIFRETVIGAKCKWINLINYGQSPNPRYKIPTICMTHAIQKHMPWIRIYIRCVHGQIFIFHSPNLYWHTILWTGRWSHICYATLFLCMTIYEQFFIYQLKGPTVHLTRSNEKHPYMNGWKRSTTSTLYSLGRWLQGRLAHWETFYLVIIFFLKLIKVLPRTVWLKKLYII